MPENVPDELRQRGVTQELWAQWMGRLNSEVRGKRGAFDCVRLGTSACERHALRSVRSALFNSDD